MQGLLSRRGEEEGDGGHPRQNCTRADRRGLGLWLRGRRGGDGHVGSGHPMTAFSNVPASVPSAHGTLYVARRGSDRNGHSRKKSRTTYTKGTLEESYRCLTPMTRSLLTLCAEGKSASSTRVALNVPIRKAPTEDDVSPTTTLWCPTGVNPKTNSGGRHHSGSTAKSAVIARTKYLAHTFQAGHKWDQRLESRAAERISWGASPRGTPHPK